MKIMTTNITASITQLLSACEEFGDVTIKVEDVSDDSVWFNINDDTFIEVTKLHNGKLEYKPGFFKALFGGHWEPEDVAEMYLPSAKNVMEACLELVKWAYGEKFYNITEIQQFEDR